MEKPGVGYCRRGIDLLVRGKAIPQALAIVERSCSFAGHSHRMAVCQAIEAATDLAPSPRALLIRALFAEAERVLARLWILAQTARAAGIQALFRDALAQRELLFEALVSATGQRLYWGVAEPGGEVTFEGSAGLETVYGAFDQLESAVQTWRIAVSPRGPLGRTGAGVGRISAERAAGLAPSSLVARAAGAKGDLRRDAPYGAYAQITFDWADAAGEPSGGDVAARMAYAVADCATSLRLAQAFRKELSTIQDSALDAHLKPTRPNGQGGQAAVEGPHGPVEAGVTLSPSGDVDQLSLRLPSARLVSALPELLADQRLELIPMILASLDLCMECADL